MRIAKGHEFPWIYDEIVEMLLAGDEVESVRWQGQSIVGRSEMTPIEVRDVVFEMWIPKTQSEAEQTIFPNLPWAEQHFQERVCGRPLNPPPSAKTWPFAQAGHADHTDDFGMFSHTYPERFWPRHAGHDVAAYCDGSPGDECEHGSNRGVRYEYGDLTDVVNLLRTEPSTRQAYLPIWFPEDTGANEGQRVPCSLGYHFMIRGGRLHVTYLIRAVDFMRHFKDDVYMAVRLAHWIIHELGFDWLKLGMLNMHTMSMHVFVGDRPALAALSEAATERHARRLFGAMG